MTPLIEALARWDAAFAALKRRDYAEYDRITGFNPTRERAESNKPAPRYSR